mgnify:CR=1 FL=1
MTALGVAHKTYWFVSSDHGYNLGGHRLPSNKFLLYDHSLRIPMVHAYELVSNAWYAGRSSAGDGRWIRKTWWASIDWLVL